MTLTLSEVARRLGISAATARKLNLPSVLIGKRYRYPEAGLTEFIRGNCRPEARPAA